jgi:hypothetical protein
MNLGDVFIPTSFDINSLELFDKWILHALNQTIKKTNGHWRNIVSMMLLKRCTISGGMSS